MNIIDKLIEKIIMTKNPSVIGLDPDIYKIPSCYKANCGSSSKDVSAMIEAYNRDIIDIVAPYVPAVKPQMAFYEAYGSYGVRAFEKTVLYAKQKGLIVIEDAKRNDIGNTARLYADGHLGRVVMPDGSDLPIYDVDFLTVSPFLGSESLMPFISVCNAYNKGIFVLIKTSNMSAGEIQDCKSSCGKTVSQLLAEFVFSNANASIGEYNYSPIGAVVGATYPWEIKTFRDQMPHSFILVPGYGAQGGTAMDIISSFDEKGLGAIINSSRNILFSHMSDFEREHCSQDVYLQNVERAVIRMKNDIYQALQKSKRSMVY